jgi:hypothetical protein
VTLSAIQAILKGREEVPEYLSGALVKTETHKGLRAWYEEWDQTWLREAQSSEAPDRDEGVVLPDSFLPVIGAACLLGAQGVAMGCPTESLTQEDSFYAHPDFYENPKDREWVPTGFVFTSGNEIVPLKYAEFPCACPNLTLPWSGVPMVASKSDRIPVVIAHLNDQHDPRSDVGMKEQAVDDPWTEERIVNWLRSLGYNGDH